MDIFNIDSNLDYLLKVMGKDIKINNLPARAIIQHTQYKEVEEKKIITKSELKRGNLINYSNHDYLIINEINSPKRDSYYKAFIQSCNYSIKFIVDGTLKEFPSIIRNEVFDVKTGSVIDLLVGEIQVTLQANKYTNLIEENMRFIKLKKAWQIIGIDYTKEGLIILNAKVTEFVPEDDKENEIANADKLIKYTIEASDIEVTKDSTSIINAKLFANGIEVSNPTLAYVSNDTNICTVLEDGTVTGLNEGNTTITIIFEDKATKNINVVVKVIPVENLELTIVGSPTQYRKTEQIYSAKLTNNGVDVSSDYTYNWSITNKDSTSNIYATIKSIAPAPFGKDCTVLTKELADKFIILTCECREKPHLTFSKEIEIIDIW